MICNFLLGSIWEKKRTLAYSECSERLLFYGYVG